MDFDGTMSLDFVEEAVRKSFYYIPDEIYTSERNADPCPFVPKSMQNWYLENAPYGSKAYNDAMCYRFVEICRDFVKKRWDRWEGFCRTLFCLFGLVGLGLIGTHAESLIVYIPSYVLLTIILLCIPVQRMTPFSKRKSQYVLVDKYYEDWMKREKKRRWELALRNTDRFNLPKPKKGIFVTPDYQGRLYVDDI